MESCDEGKPVSETDQTPAPDTSDRQADAGSRARWPRLGEMRLAASFLTILPVLGRVDESSDAVVGSLGWFPLIGFILGGVLAVEDAALTGLFGRAIAAALVVLTLQVVTGAVHLDGLADTADALGAGRDRRRAMEILLDSRIGSFGAAAIFLFLALEIIALATMGGAQRLTALWLAPGLARWAMVAVSWRVDYLRKGGAGAALLRPGDERAFVIAGAVAVVAALPVLSWRVLVAYAVAAALAAVFRAVYRRWLGGVTGDLIGAAGEVVELAVMLVMAAA